MWRAGSVLVQHRDLALYIGTSFLRTMALQIQATALAWQIYEITRDPFKLGLVGLLEFLPAILLALPAGHLADHVDRRRVILYGTAGSLLMTVVLFGLAASDRMTEIAILALALTFGIARSITVPSARAIMPSLVPKENLARAVAWSSTSWQVAAIAGPGVGGLLYSIAPQFAYGGAMIAFAGATLLIYLMRGRPIAATTAGVRDRADILGGLSLIMRSRLLLGTLSLDLFAVLFSGATALIPVFAQDILHVGADAGGLLRSAQSLGAAVTAILLTQFPIRRRVGHGLFISVGVFGLAALAFGLSGDYWLSFAAILVLGAADMVSIYIRSTLIPLATPENLRGRVIAIETMFIGASNEVGTFIAGSASALIGPVAAVVVGGSMTLVVTLVWATSFPQLRKVDKFEELG